MAVHELFTSTTVRESATWQSIYHFTVGHALEDGRVLTKPPYEHLAADARARASCPVDEKPAQRPFQYRVGGGIGAD